MLKYPLGMNITSNLGISHLIQDLILLIIQWAQFGVKLFGKIFLEEFIGLGLLGQNIGILTLRT